MTLLPDSGAARRFLLALNGNGPQIFQTFGNAPGKAQSYPEWRYGTFADLKPWLIDENNSGMGVYFLVNQSDGQGRTIENIKQIIAWWVDLDGAPLDPVLNCAMKPHIVTESSAGRFQAFWLLEPYICEPFKFTTVMKHLAAEFQGDPAVCDLARVMRLPGFWHLKAEPFQTRIIELHSDLPRYAPKELYDGLGLKRHQAPTNECQPHVSTPIGTGQRIPQGMRNRMMVGVSARLRNALFTGERLYEEVMAVNLRDCDPPLTEKEIRRITGWADRKEASPIRPARAKYDEGSYHEKPVTEEPRTKYPAPIPFNTLEGMDIPPVNWIVDGLLPEGLCILGGRPKAGKSWLIQALACAVAGGTDVLGCFKTNQGSVLSLSLEDTDRRFKDRMIKIMEGQPCPPAGYFSNKWPSLPDAVDALDSWLVDHPDARLVVIDTLAKIRSQKKPRFGANSYDLDYQDIGRVQSLAGKHHVAIIIIHHLKKGETEDDMDSISGTAGITGSADTIWLLKRPDRQKLEAELVMTGRDIEDARYALQFDRSNGHWNYNAECKVSMNTALQNEIIELLDEAKRPLKTFELAEMTGKRYAAINQSIKALTDKGVIEKSVTGKAFILVRNERIEDEPAPDWGDP